MRQAGRGGRNDPACRLAIAIGRMTSRRLFSKTRSPAPIPLCWLADAQTVNTCSFAFFFL